MSITHGRGPSYVCFLSFERLLRTPPATRLGRYGVRSFLRRHQAQDSGHKPRASDEPKNPRTRILRGWLDCPLVPPGIREWWWHCPRGGLRWRPLGWSRRDYRQGLSLRRPRRRSIRKLGVSASGFARMQFFHAPDRGMFLGSSLGWVCHCHRIPKVSGESMFPHRITIARFPSNAPKRGFSFPHMRDMARLPRIAVGPLPSYGHYRGPEWGSCAGSVQFVMTSTSAYPTSLLRSVFRNARNLM